VPHWLHSLLHWLQWGTVPAWIAAVVSVWSADKSRRSRRKSEAAELEAKEQARLAIEAAEDAVAAQKQIAGETKRLADVAEQRLDVAEQQLDVAEQQLDAAERYPWDIKPDGGYGCYRLINKRDTPKYDIYVSGDRTFPNRINHFRSIDGAGTRAIYLQDSGVVNRKVRVRWRPTKDYSGELWPQDLEP
jgi:multidrug efflux pump subunit AcrA (membrane-fusion protein)